MCLDLAYFIYTLLEATTKMRTLTVSARHLASPFVSINVNNETGYKDVCTDQCLLFQLICFFLLQLALSIPITTSTINTYYN